MAQAQPDAMPICKLRFDEVVCIETPGALSPSTVIRSGQNFWLRTDIGGEGPFGPPVFNLLHWDVFHFAEDIVHGGSVALPGVVTVDRNVLGAFPPEPGIWSIVSGPYTTGPGNQLPDGSYRILTSLRLEANENPILRSRIGGSHQLLIVEVIP
jgi:hypothetical protein